ncbi:MAG: heme o synthase [Polyangia bacterium]
MSVVQGTSAPGTPAPVTNPVYRTTVADLIALGKPRVTFLVIVTAFGGMWLSPMPLHLGYTLLALFAINLVVYGASALNMYLEVDTDALMVRTRNRPLPSGRMNPELALWIGLAASVVSVALCTLCLNPLTGLLAALSLIIYVLAYTPWKRRSTLALIIGAIPGAAPPLMGWTAATGRIDPGGLTLFFILFVWQIPHFLAISIFRKDDYVAAGLKVVPGVLGVAATKVRIALYAALLGVTTLPAYATGISSRAYLWVAVPLSLGFLVLAVSGLRVDSTPESDNVWARRVFVATLFHLPIVILALAIFRRV